MQRSNSFGRRRNGGFAMVEVVISSGIMALLAGGILSLMRDASNVFHSSVRAAQARRHCVSVLDNLGLVLEEANGANLAIDTTHAECDRLTLQVPLGLAAGAVSWGADALHPNAYSQYLLTPDSDQSRLWRLVRRIVDVNGVALAPDEVLVENVDAPEVGLGKGFTVQRNNHFVTAGLRLRLSADNNVTDTGKDLIRAQQISIRLRLP